MLRDYKPLSITEEDDSNNDERADYILRGRDGKPLAIIKAKRIKEFGNEIGTWLWSKLKGIRSKKHTGLFEQTRAVTAHIKRRQEERTAIIDAFEHDITFYDNINDPHFHFAYISLSKDAKTVLKPMLVAFYDILRDGFLLQSQPTQQYYNRQNVAYDFWKDNKGTLTVCPACDGEGPRIVKGYAHSDVDHFFPKSLYPFLSIHALNLVPICTDCNRYFKGDTDPIEDHTCESLTDTFHPYANPAMNDIEVQLARRNQEGDLKVQLIDKKLGVSSSRIKNLNRLFRLQELWEDDYIARVIDRLRQDFRDAPLPQSPSRSKSGPPGRVRFALCTSRPIY